MNGLETLSKDRASKKIEYKQTVTIFIRLVPEHLGACRDAPVLRCTKLDPGLVALPENLIGGCTRDVCTAILCTVFSRETAL
jgi:hypothetical protein